MKNRVSEMKILLILERINSGLDKAENQINNLEYKIAKNSQSEQQKRKQYFKNEDSLRDLWENIKHNNICITGLPEEEREQRIKTYLRTSGQDGGIGRHASPPYTTIRRITTNLKTKNTQNCQKIKLYGSPTAKNLKKRYSSRR